jgi:predicted nucleic acid-binding Zn ribbon protein
VNAPARTRSKGVRTLTPWGSYNGVPADALLPYPVAQDIKDRSVFWYLRRCPVCQQAKPMRSFRRSCSNNCKGVLISITRSPENTAKMAAVAHANTSKRAELRDCERIVSEGLDPIAAYRLGRRRGYRLGETRGICRERRRWENGL